MVLSYRVNPGPLPPGHWLTDPQEGGRIVGEACHFIDLAAFLTGEQPSRVFATGTPGHPEPTTIVIELSGGSILDLTYTHDGPQRLPKERLEVFQGSSSWILDDWRSLDAYSGTGHRRLISGGPKKGHAEELAAFFDSIRGGGDLPIPLATLLSTTMATFSAIESARTGSPIDVPSV
jgi:predicted dehydrogenase